MQVDPPYNPLDKKNLGVSVADALLARNVVSIQLSESFIGAGIYALYYAGDFSAYQPIAEANRKSQFKIPIYVGKAIPAGARKGGYGWDVSPGDFSTDSRVFHKETLKTVNLYLASYRFYHPPAFPIL